MTDRYDVIVVGVGSMGSAACYQLAMRGAGVLGLEQFSIPNTMGSHHGDSRMIRLCYAEHPDYVPLLQRAYDLWHELEIESGQRLLFKTGGLYMGRGDGGFVNGALQAAKQHHLPHEMMERTQIAERYPQFALPDDYVALYEPAAGFLLSEQVIATHARLALQHGATLHGQEQVTAWHSSDGRVSVTTHRATYEADHIIFCGGAWSSQLLGEVGVSLTVTRQVLGWVWPQQPELFKFGALPVWAVDHDDDVLHYGFPMLGGPGEIGAAPGFKLARHWQAALTDPNHVDRQAHDADEQEFRPFLQQFIPYADGPLLAMRICLYNNSPDSHFIVGPHPKHKHVTLACGFSGHGFKFAAVIGQVLADLATQGKTELPIEFLSIDRFT